MNRRGADRTSLHERVHGTPPPLEGLEPSRSPDPLAIRHCWVTDEHRWLPALLLEWRRTVSGWQGRVVRPVLEDGCWVVVEEWLPANQLSP